MKKILVIAATSQAGLHMARMHGMTPNECAIIPEGDALRSLRARYPNECVAWLCHGAHVRHDIDEVLEYLKVQGIPAFRMDGVTP